VIKLIDINNQFICAMLTGILQKFSIVKK